jgi:hypothetical protein
MADVGTQTHLDRLFRGICVEAIIEKIFRFIEMIVIATLIGVVMRVVSLEGSKWVAGGLYLAAGLYLGIPTARWAGSHIPPSRRRSPFQALILFLFGYSAILMASPLRVLLSETFKIDEPTARIDYQLWEARSSLRNCFGGRPPGPPPDENKIAACERKWKSEIGRLEAEKHGLIR